MTRKKSTETDLKENAVQGIAVGVSVTTGDAVVHLRLKQDDRVIVLDLSPSAARDLALLLLQVSADARAMEGFRTLLFSDDLGEDKLPLGTVRKILHAMSRSQLNNFFVQNPPQEQPAVSVDFCDFCGQDPCICSGPVTTAEAYGGYDGGGPA